MRNPVSKAKLESNRGSQVWPLTSMLVHMRTLITHTDTHTHEYTCTKKAHAVSRIWQLLLWYPSQLPAWGHYFVHPKCHQDILHCSSVLFWKDLQPFCRETIKTRDGNLGQWQENEGRIFVLPAGSFSRNSLFAPMCYSNTWYFSSSLVFHKHHLLSCG